MTLNDVLTLVLMLPLAAAAWRMIVGPTFVDRVVAMDMLTGVAVAAAALTAATTQRREFLDVAFGVAVISFVGTCAFAAFIERRSEGRR
jgi:multicomponent Na+:H+ antiporter subunit F